MPVATLLVTWADGALSRYGESGVRSLLDRGEHAVDRLSPGEDP